MPVEKAGASSPLLDQAYAIGDLTKTTENQPKPTANEPTAGSYEAFMGSFGAPRRWAGAN